MKKITFLFILMSSFLNAQQRSEKGFTTLPTGVNMLQSAIIQFDSTTKGMIVPRMTTTQKNAIASPATSLLVFDTTLNKYTFYNGSIWTVLALNTDIPWTQTGNNIRNNNIENVEIQLNTGYFCNFLNSGGTVKAYVDHNGQFLSTSAVISPLYKGGPGGIPYLLTTTTGGTYGKWEISPSYYPSGYTPDATPERLVMLKEITGSGGSGGYVLNNGNPVDVDLNNKDLTGVENLYVEDMLSVGGDISSAGNLSVTGTVTSLLNIRSGESLQVYNPAEVDYNSISGTDTGFKFESAGVTPTYSIDLINLGADVNRTMANVASGTEVVSVNTKTANTSGNITLNQDDVLDGTTFKQYSNTEKTKLAGLDNSNLLHTTGNETASGIKTFSNGTNQPSTTYSGTASPAYAQGKLVYDTDNESMTFYNNDSAIGLQVGQEDWIRVKNVSGSTITNGQAVYINGSSAGLPTIALAQANSGTTTVGVGLTTESIANNAIGYVTALGVVHGLNTSGFSVGAVYISAVTPGALTQTAPTSPNYRYRVGFVTMVDAVNGTVHVTPSTASLGNGTSNQVAGINSGGTAQEYKSILGTSARIDVNNTAGAITVDLSSTLEALLSKKANTVDVNNASSTSANVRTLVNDETGAGLLVFNDAPTFATAFTVTTGNANNLMSTNGGNLGNAMTYVRTTTLGADPGTYSITPIAGSTQVSNFLWSLAPYTASATLDFPNTSSGTSSDLTITVTGAVAGKPVYLGIPNAAVNANSSYSAWVSATNTVTVRLLVVGVSAVNPASASFTVNVSK